MTRFDCVKASSDSIDRGLNVRAGYYVGCALVDDGGISRSVKVAAYSSGWHYGNDVFIYRRRNGKWIGRWETNGFCNAVFQKIIDAVIF